MTISRLLPAALVALGLSSNAFADKAPLVALDLVRLDPEVPSAQAEGVSNALANELLTNFTLVPRAEVDALRTGAEKPADASGPVALIAEARQQILNFNFKAAH